MTIKIGTRQSDLALKQTELVCKEIQQRFPDIQVEIIKKQTSGDKNLSAPLIAFGGKGAFVSEFEEMLLSGQIDIAIHSAKDLPSKLPENLEIAAVLKRDDPRDVIVYRNKADFMSKLHGNILPIIGTSSLRRELQLKNLYDCQVKMLRGNVPTRLDKLNRGEYDAVILAAAGLKRLGLLEDIEYDFLSFENMIPAGGQAIIAIESVKTNIKVQNILKEINHQETYKEFLLERFILEKLNCGCHEPTGVFSRVMSFDDGEYINISLIEKKCAKMIRCCVSGKYKNIYDAALELLTKKNQKSQVYLVGAGPGKESLISEEGLNLLKKCNAVIYDNLVNPLLLQYVPENCRKIYVGKIPSCHSKKQEEINDILIEQAVVYSGEIIVRLKGGDPFVFGRGGEEIVALETASIPYIVVPGVTSAIAALESAGIPVTHRREARSFHVITGHIASDDNGSPNNRFEQYAKLEGTLVFLMGVGSLKEIVHQLIKGGKDIKTPVAIVEHGTTIRQRRLDGNLETIISIAEKNNLKNPAVICVGEVAKYHMKSNNLPLSAKKIAVTGTYDFTKRLGTMLEESGSDTYCAPILKIIKNNNVLDCIPDLDKIDWLIFTSGTGVRVFFTYLMSKKVDLRLLRNIRFCVIGTGTQHVLQEYGFMADFVTSHNFTVDQMAKEFAEMLKSQSYIPKGRIIALRSENGSKALKEIFDKENISFTDMSIYSVEEDAFVLDLLSEQLDILDYITFASSSGVKTFFDRLGTEVLNKVKPNCKFVCIGTKTEESLVNYNIVDRSKIIVAKKFTVSGIMEAIKNDK